MARYEVTYARDEGGWWIARVRGVSGVHSNGRTIAEARRRVREALALAVGDTAAERADLVDNVQLPASLRSRITGYRRVRAAEQKARNEALDVARILAPALVRNQRAGRRGAPRAVAPARPSARAAKEVGRSIRAGDLPRPGAVAHRRRACWEAVTQMSRFT
jgi:predicted RNase H-like HicB family nuclease